MIFYYGTCCLYLRTQIMFLLNLVVLFYSKVTSDKVFIYAIKTISKLSRDYIIRPYALSFKSYVVQVF